MVCLAIGVEITLYFILFFKNAIVCVQIPLFISAVVNLWLNDPISHTYLSSYLISGTGQVKTQLGQ